MAVVKSSFAKTGIFPFNRQAIVIPSTGIKDDSTTTAASTVNGSTESSSTAKSSHCSECHKVVYDKHPVPSVQILPHSIRQAFIVPGTKTQVAKTTQPSHRIIKEGRVLTGSEVMQSVREKDAKKKHMEKMKEERKRKKIEKEEQSKKKRKTSTEAEQDEIDEGSDDESCSNDSDEDNVVCLNCEKVEPPGSGVIDWVTCDVCQKWLHSVCLSTPHQAMCHQCIREEDTTSNQSESDDELCIICENKNPPGKQDIIKWFQCDNCMGWVHNVCCTMQSALDHEDDVFLCNICTELVKA